MSLDNLFSGTIGAIIGVIFSSIITYKLNLKSEKMLIRKKIIIDKLEVLIGAFYEYLREIARLENLTVKFILNEVDLKEYKLLNDEYQDKVTIYGRTISENLLFIKKYKGDYDKFINRYTKICDLLYDKYYSPESKNKRYNPNDYTFEDIQTEFQKVIIQGSNIIKNLQGQLEQELDA